jgi:SAM-dependent methyltransferase
MRYNFQPDSADQARPNANQRQSEDVRKLFLPQHPQRYENKKDKAKSKRAQKYCETVKPNPANWELRTVKSEPSLRKLPGLAARDGFLPHPWDQANGVRTSGLVVGRHLKSGHGHDRHITAYYGVAPSVFHRLLRRWQHTRPAAAIASTTFVDIGAGMGRAVLLASELPFRQVIGVELHPALARRARKNAGEWRKAGRACAPIRIVNADAVEFAFPPRPCVAFLFNPFGATVMRHWLRAAAKAFAARPGQLDILYVNNEQEGEFENMRRRGFARLFLGRINRSPADAKADHRILGNQPDGEYASADFEDCSIWRWQGKP